MTVNTSTALLLTLPAENGVSNQQRRLKSAPPSTHHMPPSPFPPITTHTQHSAQSTPKNNKPVKPPANIANPSAGSDTATRLSRATLRAAVLHRPLLALKMSTTSLRELPAQRHQQSAAAAQSPPPSTHHMQPPSSPPIIKTHATRNTIYPKKITNL